MPCHCNGDLFFCALCDFLFLFSFSVLYAFALPCFIASNIETFLLRILLLLALYIGDVRQLSDARGTSDIFVRYSCVVSSRLFLQAAYNMAKEVDKVKNGA